MSRLAGRRVAIGAGSLAVLLGALDTYVVVTIMRDIMHDVGIPINQLQRITPIVTMYLLGYIAAMPLLGRASDRFGRKLTAAGQPGHVHGRLGGHRALGGRSATSIWPSMNVQILGHPLQDLLILGYPVVKLHVPSLHVLVAGRTIQGVASGALLPVTLALGADLWAQRNRAGRARRYRRRAGAGQRAGPALRHFHRLVVPRLA